MMKKVILYLLMGSSAVAQAQDGALDPTYTVGSGTNFRIFAACPALNGKTLIAGDFTTYNGQQRVRVARINTDGTVDPGFTTGTGSDGTLKAIAQQPDGKVIIGGEFLNTYNGSTVHNIARLYSNGTLDASFVQGSGLNWFPYAIAVQPDGKILVGGGFNQYNGIASPYLVRLNADGSFDNTFTSKATGYVRAIAVQPDGKIIIGGGFSTYDGVARTNLARINSNGSLDASFNTSNGPGSTVSCLALQPDGRVLIAGWFNNIGGYPQRGIGRINADGSRDTRFTATANDIANALTLLPDGKIMVSGNFNQMNGQTQGFMSRLNVDGTLDATFQQGTGANFVVDALAAQTDGNIVIGGNYASYNGTARANIARVYGSLLPAQISTGTLAGTSYCAGSTIQVPYAKTNYFGNGNLFTVQLSDASGSFANPVTIGTLTSASSGTINATIPANTPAGAGYRVRVAGDLPLTQGTDNGTNITINAVTDGGALSFGNSNDYAISNNNVGITGSAARTIEYWAQLTGNYEHQVNWGGTFTNNAPFGTYTTTNTLYVYGWGAGDYAVPNFTPDGSWHHVAVTYSGSALKVYIDGVEKTPTGGVSRSYNTTDGKLVIGMREDIANNIANFAGKMDEIRIWNRALCQGEIQNNMNGELSLPQNGLLIYYKMNAGTALCNNSGLTTLTDATGNNNATLVNFTLNGSSSNWVSGKVSGAATDFVAPAVNPVSNQTVCNGSSTTAVNFGSSNNTYTWTISRPTIGLASTGTGNIGSFAAINNGSVQVAALVRVTASRVNCFSTATFTYTVYPTPNATMAYASSSFNTGSGTAAVTMGGTVGKTGGTFSSTTGLVINAQTGVIDLAASSAGTYTVTYTMTLAGPCPTYTTSTIVTLINPFVATISYPGTPYCASTGSVAVLQTGTTGGTYTASPTGLVINAATGAIDIAASAAGSYTVRYGVSATDFTTAPVVVRPASAFQSAPNQVLCNGAQTTAIDFAVTSGLQVAWSNNDPSVGLAASGAGNIPAFIATNASLLPVTATVNVSVSGGTECTFKGNTFRFTIKPSPVATAVSSQELCAGLPTSAVAFQSNVAGTTFSWTNNNTTIGLGASGTGDIPSFAAVNNTSSVQTATLTATPVALGCAGIPVQFYVTTSPSVQSIAYTGSPFCQAGAVQVQRMGSAGGTYTSSPAGLTINSATGEIKLGASIPGNYTITYTVTGNGSCTRTAAAAITIRAQSGVNPENNQLWCNGSTVPPLTWIGPNVTFNWVNDNPTIGLAASGTGDLPSFTATNGTALPKNAFIKVYPQGSGSTYCPGKVMQFRITVNPANYGGCGPVAQNGNTGGNANTARAAIGMSISPNPSAGSTTVTLLESGSYTLQLINRFGSPAGSPRAFSGDRAQVDLSGLIPGAYLLRVVNMRTGAVMQQQVVKL